MAIVNRTNLNRPLTWAELDANFSHFGVPVTLRQSLNRPLTHAELDANFNAIKDGKSPTATITARTGLGRPLTHAEIDANFASLNSSIFDYNYWTTAITNNHEALPKGVNTGYDWYTHARPGGSGGGLIPPTNFTAMMGWGQAFTVNGFVGSVHPTRLQLKNFKLHICHGENRTWSLLQTAGQFTGAAYHVSFSDASVAPTYYSYDAATGVTTADVDPDSRLYHFFFNNRVLIPTDGIHAIVVTVDAKNETPIQTDCWLLGLGMDYWRSMTATWVADFSNNGDAGIGRLGKVGNDWRRFGFVVDPENLVNTLVL